MRQNIVKEKSFALAIETIRLARHLQKDKKEFVLSKQLLESGTAIGALIRESEYAESKLDFAHKMAIAQKECNETIYWLELLEKGEYINKSEIEPISNDAIEILKIITASIKTIKKEKLMIND
jgi:four helix bundle protein